MSKMVTNMIRTVCVFCGSSDAVHPDYLAGARQMGRILAQRGLRLVYGGGRTGLMGALADGALQAGGEVIGVIVPSMNTPQLAHNGLTCLEVEPTMHARKARMHQLAEAFVALPGGYGTLDELFEALTWAQIGSHEKPIGLLNLRGYYDPLLAALDHAVNEGFIFAEHRQAICCETDPERLLAAISNHRPARAAVKRWMRQENQV